MALKDAHGGKPWYEWEPELVAREPDGAATGGASELAEGIRFHEFVQYVFELQWQALCDGAARTRGSG